MKKSCLLLLVLLNTIFSISFAQSDDNAEEEVIVSRSERMIVESKWRYTYALHLESNTIIHQAEDFYDYYLHFRYDYIYEQYLNGEMSKGTWSLNDEELFYSFKHIKKFKIAEINKKTLLLEFTQPNSKGTYQYHFIRVESKDAPFVKPLYELPDVLVERDNPNGRRKLFSFAKRKNKKKRKRKNKKSKKTKEKPTFINIELIGGGYYGGIDPVQRDYIHIKSDGRLVKEFKGANSGLVVTKKTISRNELEQFAEFIIAQKFFEFDRIYDCDASFCEKRKYSKPTPIPLRLSIAYGGRKKVITISIYGRDKHKTQYVDYPSELDNIIEAIRRMADGYDRGAITRKN